MPHRLWAGIIVVRQTDWQDDKAMLFTSPARDCDTPCKLVIYAPLDMSFTCRRRGAAHGGDEVLVGAFASIRRRSDDYDKRVGSQLCSERRGYRLGGQGW